MTHAPPPSGRIATTLAQRMGIERLADAVLDVVDRVFAARASWMLLLDPATDELEAVACHGLAANYYEGYTQPSHRGLAGCVLRGRRPLFVPDASTDTRWTHLARMVESGIRSAIVLPLRQGGAPIGVVGFDSPRFSKDHPPLPADYDQFRAFVGLTALAVAGADRLAAFENDQDAHPECHADGLHGRPLPEISDAQNRDGATAKVVGPSDALQGVLQQVRLVAPADSGVLLLGETGTGKELIAREVHHASGRKSQPFVACNCAALPETLIESELFGHEKGAFTGATARRAGCFERADRGTLFLDEIGDMPLQLQVKLLRVLQEREIMRLGSAKPVPVNVRVVAATNQDLKAAMDGGRFRPDLFYRLNVFLIVIPPLRERRDDIPPLAFHFVRSFGDRIGKKVTGITPGALERLVAHDWPGNVRELQNVIERAVVLTRYSMLDADVIEVRTQPAAPVAVGITNSDANVPSNEGGACPVPAPANAHDGADATTGSTPHPVEPFREAERRAILRALDATAWRVSGPIGAAQLLGLKPTTLHAKMKRLDIRRPSPS